MNALIPLAPRGEVLPAYVSVLWLPHVFRDSERERHYLPAGATLAEIVEDVCGDPAGVRAWADGVRIEPEDWAHTCPARDVTLRRVPRPFVVPLIPIIAATLGAALVPAAGFTIAGLAISATVAGAAIAAVGALASLGLSMLFRPSAPKQLTQLNNREASPTYSITSIGNQETPYGTVPITLGQHRLFPPFAMKPFTEVIGGDQYLNCLFCLGYSTLDVEDVKIGETPVSRFDDVELNFETYTPGVRMPKYLSNQVDEEVLQIDLGTGDAPATSDPRTTEPDTDAISVDVLAPQGVYAIDVSGNDRTHRAKIRIQYRAVGSGTWITWAEKELKNKVRGEVVRVGYRWGVDRGQYEVRIVRLPYTQNEEEFQIQEDQTFWTMLRSHRFDDPVTFDGQVALAFLRIRATDQLSGGIDSFNLIAQQRGWKYTDGGNWVSGAVIRSPADIFRTLLTHPANSKPIATANIDFSTLNPWALECIQQGWQFSQVRDFEASFWDTLSDVCAAGRAMPVVIDGKWGVIWEQSKPPAVVQAFTPRNTMGFGGERTYEEPPHGYRVIFINELAGYQQDERIVYDDGYSKANATIIEGLELPGITNPDLLWRLGRYHIAQRRLRREIYTLEVDIEHAAVRRGDRVRVNHDVPLWGGGYGKVLEVTGAVVKLDERVTMVAGDQYAIRFRSVAGNNHLDLVRTVETVPGDGFDVTLTGSGALPDVGDMFMFGEVARESVVLRVLAVRPGDDFTAIMSLVDDAPGVLLADQGEIPPFDTQISTPIVLNARAFAATDLRISERLVFEGEQALAELRFSFRPPRLAGIAWHQVQYRADEEDTWTRSLSLEPSQRETTVRVAPGQWLFRVRSHVMGPPRSATSWAQISYNASKAFNRPPPVTGARITISGDRARLTWNTAGISGVRGVEVRHSAAIVNATAATARVLAVRATNGSIEVPNLRGTYLLRWEGANRQFSHPQTSIVNTVAGLTNYNVVELANEHPTFPGTKTNLSVSSGEMILADEGLGTYQFANTVDLGAVHPARVSFNAVVSAENISDTYFGSDGTLPYFDGGPWFSVDPEDWSIRFEFRETDDNPAGTPVWSNWMSIDISEVAGRAFQFRTVVESFQPGIRVVISELTGIVDMPDRTFGKEDISVPAAGLRVAFVPAFKNIPAVGGSIQNGPTGAEIKWSSRNQTGVNVQVVNESGTGIAASVDVIAKGYGQVIT